jgi:DNA gyrase/topoisomerase IV subunit A
MAEKNVQLEIFRIKVRFLLEQYAAKMHIFVAENKAADMSIEAIKIIRENPLSRWAMEREALNKAIKREVAGLINRIHIAAYTREIK